MSVACSEPLTLQRCFELSEKQSELLAVQSERVVQARERLSQARAAFLPELSYNYSRFQRDTDGADVTGDGADSRFTVTQSLFEGGRNARSLSLSKSQLRREELQAKITLRSIKEDTAAAFYTLAQVDADIKNIENTIQLFTERARELNQRVKLGKSRESEVLMIESQLAVLRSQEEQALGQRKQVLESLSFLTGMEAGSIEISYAIEQKHIDVPVEQFIEKAMRRSDILAIEEDKKSQEYRMRIARGALMPSLDMDGSWYTSRAGSLANVDWELGLSLRAPIFSGGDLRSRLREQKSALRTVEIQENRLKREIASEITRLYDTLQTSLAQSAALKDAYEKAGKSSNIQQRDYRLGLVNNLEVLQSMTTLLDVKRSFDRAAIQVMLDIALLNVAAEE